MSSMSAKTWENSASSHTPSSCSFRRTSTTTDCRLVRALDAGAGKNGRTSPRDRQAPATPGWIRATGRRPASTLRLVELRRVGRVRLVGRRLASTVRLVGRRLASTVRLVGRRRVGRVRLVGRRLASTVRRVGRRRVGRIRLVSTLRRVGRVRRVGRRLVSTLRRVGRVRRVGRRLASRVRRVELRQVGRVRPPPAARSGAVGARREAASIAMPCARQARDPAAVLPPDGDCQPLLNGERGLSTQHHTA